MKTKRLLRRVLASLSLVMLLAVSESFGSTIWPTSAVPIVADAGPDNPVEVGVAFQADTGGYVTGIRFYKAATNIGLHPIHLWTVEGDLLATAISTAETQSGWQQVDFAVPIPVTAQKVYVASYHTTTGHYSDDQYYFSGAGVENPPLHVQVDSSLGPNGRYAYGADASFPNDGWQGSNYWVDVVFSSNASSQPVLSSIKVSPACQSLSVGAAQQFIATGVYSDGSIRDLTGQAIWSSSRSDVVTVNGGGLATAVATGSSTINVIVDNVQGSTNVTVLSYLTIWPASAQPTVIDAGPDGPVELGLRFRADRDGLASGVRFYKATANTGPHVGNLWTNTGTLLATVTFADESTSGWQQAFFQTPIAISANTKYIVSYHTNVGHYSDDPGSLTISGQDNGILHALPDGSSNPNGLYAYGGASNFPESGWQGSNYWVDVIYMATAGGDSVPPIVTSFSVPSAAASLTIPITTFTASDNIGVTGYLVTESAATPSADQQGWSGNVPTSYTFASSGTKSLFAWAKDASGNVSSSLSANISIAVAKGPEPDGWFAGDMHVHRSGMCQQL